MTAKEILSKRKGNLLQKQFRKTACFLGCGRINANENQAQLFWQISKKGNVTGTIYRVYPYVSGEFTPLEC